MRKHIENTAAKARRRLNIVKKLVNTKWGANKQTLRQLYLGYIRPTLEYSSAALSTATHTNLAPLHKVQNQALRFISGAMKPHQQVHVRLSATLSHWTSVDMLQSSQPMNATRGLNTIQTKRSSRHGGRIHGLISNKSYSRTPLIRPPSESH